MEKGRQLFRNWHGPDPRGGRPVRLGWCAVPALMWISVIRRPVGNKVAAPLDVIIKAAFLCFVPPYVWWFIYGYMEWPLPGNVGHYWLVGSLVLCVPASAAVWVRRWIGIHRGEEIHQMEAGYSWLAWYTPLPPWLTEVVLVPAIFTSAGWLFYVGPSRDLGAWLALSGASFLLLGLAELRHRISVAASISDQLIQGQSAGESIDIHAAKASNVSGQARGAHTPQFAEAASGPASPPTGFVERPGRGGGLFVFRFPRSGRRNGQPSLAASQMADRNADPRNYAEPGE
jgi:hypothetical protein